MRIMLLIGTRKGGFVATSDDRRSWTLRDPLMKGCEVNHLAYLPHTGTIVMAGKSAWWGPAVQLSDDLAATWRQPAPTGASAPKLAALQRVAQRAVADRLLTLAADTEASPEVRAMAELKITELRPSAATRAGSGAGRSDAERAHWLAIAGDFTRWLERRELPKPTMPLVAPPGDPFGEP